MALEFTKLTEVDNVEEPVDGATVIIENAGAVKRTPVRNIGKVKTINGVEPDEDGNVEIEVGTSIQPIIITKEHESSNLSINCTFADFKSLVLAGATVIIYDPDNSRIQHASDYYLYDDYIRIRSDSYDLNFRIDNTVENPPA